MLIPAAYAATLAAVREVFPGALIAGGALRDLDNRRAVKDLDIFAPNVPDVDQLQTGSIAVTGLDGFLGLMGTYGTWATPECVGVANLRLRGVEFQLIGLSSGPETILPRLDFGICRIGFDGSEVIRTDDYLADQATQTFTLLRADDSAQRDRSLRRFERLSAKYPGWSLVDPDAVDLVTF